MSTEQEKTDYKAIYENRYTFGGNTIYAADDYFLIANRTAYTEEYSRFFYKDIIALKVFIGKWPHAMLIVLIILSAIFLTITLLLDEMAGEVIFGIICGFFVLASVWVAIYGPYVRMVFKTATTEKEFFIGRQRKVMKMLAKLRPYIEKAQGSYDYRALLEETNEEEKTYKV